MVHRLHDYGHSIQGRDQTVRREITRQCSCRSSGRLLLAQRIYKLFHAVLLTFDRLQQFELRATAIEVVPFTMDFEVSVAGEMVGEEANADFEGDEPA
jgi:hypothetical protein